MKIQDAIALVQQFHRRVGAPVADKPCLLACDPESVEQVATPLALLARGLLDDSSPLLRRAGMALEELSEWLLANACNDLVGAADAFGDRLYVLLGDAVCCGLPAEAIFLAVHMSNMTKESQADCPGKAVKGPGYQRPDIKRVLEEHHGR